MRQQFLTYSEVFGKVPFTEWEELNKISPEDYLRIYGACFVVANKALEHFKANPSKPISWHEIRNFFSPDNIQQSEKVFTFLPNSLEWQHKVFSNYVTLFLLNKYERQAANERSINREDELRMLKAYLTLNEEMVDKQTKDNPWFDKDKLDLTKNENVWRFMYAAVWPFFEFNSLNIVENICIETVKAKLLFDWFAANHFECLNQIEKQLGFKAKEGFLTASKIAFDFGVQKNQLFEIFPWVTGIALQVLEAISSIDFGGSKNEDFTFFRSNPVFQIEPGRYAIRFMPFLIPAFGTGFYFKANEAYQLINPEFNFRGNFTKSFSEEYLVKTILSWCFEDKYQITEVDELLDESGKKADFIVSSHSQSVVFEVKDNLIAKEISGSFSAEVIERKIGELFCKKKGQGLIQLQSTLQRLQLLPGGKKQKRLHFGKHDFFPVILVASPKLKCSGVNLQVNAAWENQFTNEF